MKIIVTKQNADGSFDNVGTNNRAIFSGYKTLKNAIKFGALPYANGKVIRVEVYPGGNIYTECNWVIYLDSNGKRIEK